MFLEITQFKGGMRFVLEESAIAAHRGSYIDHEIMDKEIHQMSNEVLSFFNKVNKRGELKDPDMENFKKSAQALYDYLLPAQIKRDLLGSKPGEYLTVSLDDNSTRIPWELLYDGESFLCLKFAMGRVIKTARKYFKAKSRGKVHPSKALILGHPFAGLSCIQKEVNSIRKELEKKHKKIRVYTPSGSFDDWAKNVEVVSRTRDVTRQYFKRHFRDYDIVHFAGHAEYSKQSRKNGLTLADGALTPNDIKEMESSSTAFPILVFLNACESSMTFKLQVDSDPEDRVHDLASAFIVLGAEYCIGTICKVYDEASMYLAIDFYKNLLVKMKVTHEKEEIPIDDENNPLLMYWSKAITLSIGESLRRSRLKLAKKYGYNNISYLTHILYGLPDKILNPNHGEILWPNDNEADMQGEKGPSEVITC
jgi:CHAT domain-containing protein